MHRRLVRLVLLSLLTRVGTCSCGSVEPPVEEVTVASGRYVVRTVTAFGPLDAGVAADAGAGRDGGEKGGLSALSLLVDRDAGTASLSLPGGVVVRARLSPLPREVWPRACRMPALSTGSADTWHALEALELGLPRLELPGGLTMTRPLLVAGCPEAIVHLTEYRLGWLRGAFDPVFSRGPDAGQAADLRAFAPAEADAGGLWVCAGSPCVIFEAAP